MVSRNALKPISNKTHNVDDSDKSKSHDKHPSPPTSSNSNSKSKSDRVVKRPLQHPSNSISDQLLNDPSLIDSPYASKQDQDQEPKHKTKYPWLYSPKYGVRWDYDPVILRELAQEDPWVNMLIQSINKEIIQTPWKVYKETDEAKAQKRKNTSPFRREENNADKDANVEEITSLLKNPSPQISWAELIDMGMSDLLEIGSSSIVKHFDVEQYEDDKLIDETEGPLNLRIAPPETFTKEFSDKTGVLTGYWQYDTQNSSSSGSRGRAMARPTKFKPSELVWGDLNKRSNRRYGLPPTLIVQDFLQLLNLTMEQEKNYFSRGSTPSGMIVLENWDREEVEQWKEEVMNNVKGKPHKLLTVAGKSGESGGARFEPFSFNFKDLEFTEREQWYAKVIASAFQVPVSIVGLKPEKVNYNTFQGERENFESNTLAPYLQKWEKLINHQLIWPHWGEDYYFEFTPGMSESTREAISNRIVKEWNSGLVTQNEARRELGYNEVEEGDEFKEPEPQPQPGEQDLGQLMQSQKDGPLRETEEWYEFSYQPEDVKDLKGKISEHVEELWDKVLSDSEMDSIIESMAQEEKSLSSLSRRFSKLLMATDMIDDIQQSIQADANEKALATLLEASSETDLPVDEDQVMARLEDRDMTFADDYAERMESTIRDKVSEGWEEGLGPEKIKDNLREEAEDFSDWEAERIARDQLQRATGEARNEFAAQHSDKFGEVWLTAGDNRVRDAHQEMDGRWKKPNEKFLVSYERGEEKEQFPGDSEPGINCRCDTLLKPLEELEDDNHNGVLT